MSNLRRPNEINTYAVYPTSKQLLNQFFLPKIKPHLVKHSRNPQKIKKFIPEQLSNEPKRLLDGYLLLKKTNNDTANEVISAKLSGLNIVEAKSDEFLYFENLKKLDLSENQIVLEQLATFPNLQELNLSYNNIENLNNISSFTQLQVLNLSYNILSLKSLHMLSEIENLKELNLSGNELKAFEFENGNFSKLEIIDLSSNKFTSKFKSSEFWERLSNLKKLKNLSISHNKMRGIHTELLKPGDFDKLESLDFSNNIVDNQHNLICARNFESLKELIVTGNPFAKLNLVDALRLEIYTRTGAVVVNELDYDTRRKKKEIIYPKMMRVKEDSFIKKKPSLRKASSAQMIPKEISENEIKEFETEENVNNNLDFDFSRQEASSINEEENFFLTSEVGNIKQKINEEKPYDYGIENGHTLSSNEIAMVKFEEFQTLAKQYLADEKEYELPLKTASALKILKNIIYKPIVSEVFPKEEPNYMKETITIKRYKGGDAKSMEEIINKDIANMSDYGYIQRAKDSSKEFHQFRELNEVLNKIKYNVEH